MAATALIFTSCGEEYLHTEPTTSLSEEFLLSSLPGCQTLLNGIHRATYQYYSAHDRFGQKAVDVMMEALGDDSYPTERGYGWFVGFYQWTTHRNASDGTLGWVWAYYYDIINNANLLLTNLEEMEVPSSLENQRLNYMAQALTFRAHSHYMLVQLYAERYLIGGNNSQPGVPLSIVPNPGAQERSSVEAVYTQVYADINKAIEYFENGGKSFTSGATVGVGHLTYQAAYAIKARIALTTGKYSDAVTAAQSARTGKTLQTNYTYGWNKVGSEWIWGSYLIDEHQTSYASFFSHMDPSFGGYCSLGNHRILPKYLYDDLDDTDTRKATYVTASGKQRVGAKFTGRGEWTNDYLYIKAGEMYLIEAEAQARLGNYSDAKTPLETLIKARCGGSDPYDIASIADADLLDQILFHRRIDLWGEGQRWLDLKRMNVACDRSSHIGNTDQLLPAVEIVPASDSRWQFRIPIQEMNSNPHMTQND